MLASQYASIIMDLVRAHGDFEVEKWMPAKGRHPAPVPTIAHRREYPARRGSPDPVPQFWNENDSEAQKGAPVIRV